MLLFYFIFCFVGSPALFHGYADMILFPGNKELFENFENSDKNSSAVFSFNLSEGEKDMYDHKKLEFNGQWDDGSDTEDDIVMEEIDKHDILLKNRNTFFRQLCKQAISLSLCKQNRMHKNPQNYKGQPAIIPSVL